MVLMCYSPFGLGEGITRRKKARPQREADNIGMQSYPKVQNLKLLLVTKDKR